MKSVLLLGAGKIGEMISTMLVTSGGYDVTVADSNDMNLQRMEKIPGVRTRQLDASAHSELVDAMVGKFAVLSALPYFLNPGVAAAAKEAGCHYLDLTEDVASTRKVKELAVDAKTAFVPQCGLAPGFISIVAYDLAKRFDRLENVHMRVGALPKYPHNAMKYNLTWSTEGLINEYCRPCEAIQNGEVREVPPLEELEQFSFDGITYEAFNTSGGLGTLCETLGGKVKNLNYRTVRYPGHRDVLKLLLQDLRLQENPRLAQEIFEHALPMTKQDVVLVFVTVTGERDGRYMQESYAHKVYPNMIGGAQWSAIQITTSAGICAVLDMLAEGQLPQQGFIRQEDIDFKDFIANRFGAYYARPQDTVGLATAAE